MLKSLKKYLVAFIKFPEKMLEIDRRLKRLEANAIVFVPIPVDPKKEKCAEGCEYYSHCGNNYERPDEFEKFYLQSSESLRTAGVQTSMYGNWLQFSPERVEPQHLISTCQSVSFNHRMNFFDSMQIMNRFICTTHVSKPLYYKTGFISPRFFEALAVNCPALVPEAQLVNEILGKYWIVSGPGDVISKVMRIKSLSFKNREELIWEQREAMKKLNRFNVNEAVSFIESVIK